MGEGGDMSGSADANGEISEGHVQDMNKFMAHIGVCHFVEYTFLITADLGFFFSYL